MSVSSSLTHIKGRLDILDALLHRHVNARREEKESLHPRILLAADMLRTPRGTKDPLIAKLCQEWTLPSNSPDSHARVWGEIVGENLIALHIEVSQDVFAIEEAGWELEMRFNLANLCNWSVEQSDNTMIEDARARDRGKSSAHKRSIIEEACCGLLRDGFEPNSAQEMLRELEQQFVPVLT